MIYLIRHGEDDENYIGGWSDKDLTVDGINQVNKTVKYIVDNNLEINNIITSDIKRAETTASIISKQLDINYISDSSLRELNKGDLNGLDKNLSYEKYSEYIDGKVTIETKYPNGESMMDLYNRVKDLYKKISKKDKLLIVTHRGVINMLYFILNNRLPDINKTQFNVTHASLHELDYKSKMIRRIK
jgi:broad specificity phosphatase PhoE